MNLELVEVYQTGSNRTKNEGATFTRIWPEESAPAETRRSRLQRPTTARRQAPRPRGTNPSTGLPKCRVLVIGPPPLGPENAGHRAIQSNDPAAVPRPRFAGSPTKPSSTSTACTPATEPSPPSPDMAAPCSLALSARGAILDENRCCITVPRARCDVSCLHRTSSLPMSASCRRRP